MFGCWTQAFVKKGTFWGKIIFIIQLNMKTGNTHRITNIRICLEFKRRFDTKIELEYKFVAI